MGRYYQCTMRDPLPMVLQAKDTAAQPQNGSRTAFRAGLLVYYATVMFSTAAMMFAIRQADHLLSAEALGLLMIARRLSGTGSSLAQLGVSQTLIRYVGLYAKNPAAKRRYVVFAAAVWGLLTAIILPAAFLFQPMLASLCFPGASAGPTMVVWSVALMLSMVGILIAHSTLLAEQRMVWAGVVTGMEVGGFFLGLLVVLGSRSTPLNLIAGQAVGATVLSAAVVAWYCQSPWRARGGDAPPWRDVRSDFITYGLPRGVISGLDMSVLIIGPWLLRADPKQAGSLLIALTMLRVLNALLGPITKLTSALTARYVGSGDETSIERAVKMLFGMAFIASVLFTAGLVPWRDQLLRLWLAKPETIAGTSAHFSVLCWSVLPLSIFYALRGAIEMRWKTPYNLYTLLTAIAVHLVVYYACARTMAQPVAVRVAITACMWVMGILTVIWARDYLKPVAYWGLPQVAAVGTALYALSTWADQLGGIEGVSILAAAIAGGAAILVRYAPCPFMLEAWNWLRHGQPIAGTPVGDAAGPTSL